MGRHEWNHRVKIPGYRRNARTTESPSGRPGAPDAKRVAIVGDRLTTDVLFANLNGALSVHTEPLTTKGDNKVAAACRADPDRTGRWFAKLRLKLVEERGCLADLCGC